jgi:hypothetical protein
MNYREVLFIVAVGLMALGAYAALGIVMGIVMDRFMPQARARGRGRQKSGGLDAPTEQGPIAHKNVNNNKPEGGK